MRYMTNSKIILPLLVIGCLVALFITATAFTCGPYECIITNKTSQILTVFVEAKNIGEVYPEKDIKFQFAGGAMPFLIEAKSDKGELIYSRKFTGSEIYKMGSKITIIKNTNN